MNSFSPFSVLDLREQNYTRGSLDQSSPRTLSVSLLRRKIDCGAVNHQLRRAVRDLLVAPALPFAVQVFLSPLLAPAQCGLYCE